MHFEKAYNTQHKAHVLVAVTCAAHGQRCRYCRQARRARRAPEDPLKRRRAQVAARPESRRSDQRDSARRHLGTTVLRSTRCY